MIDSFKYMFKDEGFWKKYLSLLGIVFIANIFINFSGLFDPKMTNGDSSALFYILFFLGLIVMLIPYGYSISLLKSKLEGSASELPKLTILSDFMSGLKVFISALLLLVLLSVIAIVIGFVNALFAGFGSIISLICNIVLFFILLIVSFFGIAMCCRYVENPSYLTFVDFKAAAELINKGVAKYFKAYLLTVLCTAVVYLVAMLFVICLSTMGYIGLVLYCILVSVIWTYYMYVLAGIFAKSVASEKEETGETDEMTE